MYILKATLIHPIPRPRPQTGDPVSGSMWLMVAAPYARPASPGRRAGCPAAPFCKVAALPGGVARLAEQNLLQAERRLDDGASHEAAIVRPRLWMRHMSSMLALRVMHRLAEGLVALRRFTGEVAPCQEA